MKHLILILLLSISCTACKIKVYQVPGKMGSNFFEERTFYKNNDNYKSALYRIQRVQNLVKKSLGEHRLDWINWYINEIQSNIQEIKIALPSEITNEYFIAHYRWNISSIDLPKNSILRVEAASIFGVMIPTNTIHLQGPLTTSNNEIEVSLFRPASILEICELSSTLQVLISVKNLKDELLFYYWLYLPSP